MNNFFQEIFPYLMTVLGFLLVWMVKILLRTPSTNSAEIKKLREDFNELLLRIERITPTFMSVGLCGETRKGCIELNKEIILRPLQRQLEEHIKDSNQRWVDQEDEVEQLWVSLKNHAHSNQGVVISPRNT